ncbi:hypothetical protein [Aurantiacibacter luteus]|uniref:Uncharacterized protein n=1 Tax=Aurantiacibacter luteus TaxID=1581420 RepID=A0A0G9MVK7_9SPHN|nr:hypothetical protein [Aurantiacibacter luteus]KLE34746.1 hypothetical protein AAW00_11400 [Aurantiacibacter luteus]
MNISPWILAAAVAVPLAGAVAGHAMSTDPIGVRSDVTASLPQTSAIQAGAAGNPTRDRLPDHYAMETPEGRVEVAELALRGRYRDRSRWGQSDPYAGDYDIDAELARMEARWKIEESEANAAAALDARQPQLARSEPTVRYAQAPHYAAMSEARTGEPTADVIEVPAPAEPAASPYGRTIDVGAVLAMGN